MSDLHDRWRALLQAEGLAVRPPISPQELERHERRLGVRIPPDMRAFYLKGDAADLDVWDERSWITVWELGRVVPLHQEWPKEPANLRHFVVFADQGIRAWDYAIRLSGSSNVVIVPDNTSSPPVVAQSFTEFISVLISHPERLYPPAA